MYHFCLMPSTFLFADIWFADISIWYTWDMWFWYLFCLVFAKLLESVTYCLSLIFFKLTILYQNILPCSFFSLCDSNYAYIRPFDIISHLLDILFYCCCCFLFLHFSLGNFYWSILRFFILCLLLLSLLKS